VANQCTLKAAVESNVANGNRVSTLSEARLTKGKAVIHRTYDAIWNDWFGQMDIAKSNLCLTYECLDSGYRPLTDELWLNLPEWNVADASEDVATHHDAPPPSGIGWPAWKRELVHELLHEYQYKVVCRQTSPEGTAFEANHPGFFHGAGHEADFFTAIVEKASYFGVSPEILILNL
jgi:hypothetical protein